MSLMLTSVMYTPTTSMVICPGKLLSVPLRNWPVSNPKSIRAASKNAKMRNPKATRTAVQITSYGLIVSASVRSTTAG